MLLLRKGAAGTPSACLVCNLRKEGKGSKTDNARARQKRALELFATGSAHTERLPSTVVAGPTCEGKRRRRVERIRQGFVSLISKKEEKKGGEERDTIPDATYSKTFDSLMRMIFISG